MARPCLPNDGTSERQYLDLLRAIEAYGDDKPDRTGNGTRMLMGETMRFDLSDGSVPALTTKRIYIKGVVIELLWFLKGSTNIRFLVENGVSIWTEWPHKHYVQATGDAISIEAFEAQIKADPKFAAQWGELGPVYGKQWRAWQGPDGRVYDQLADLVKSIRNTPYSRRLLFTGWNVADIDKMALPPCHLLYQFFVTEGRLSCLLYQRSCDVGLGVPFNIVSASLLVRMIADQCDLEPGELQWVGGDVHIYQNHRQKLIEEQWPRVPRPFPKFQFKYTKKPASLFEYQLKDFKLIHYAPDPAIQLPIAV